MSETDERITERKQLIQGLEEKRNGQETDFDSELSAFGTNLKELEELPFEVLRQVADHFENAPNF